MNIDIKLKKIIDYLAEKEAIGIIHNATLRCDVNFRYVEFSIIGISYKMWQTLVNPEIKKLVEIVDFRISTSIDHPPLADVYIRIRDKK